MSSKLDLLHQYIKQLEKVLIAYSGGVDSTFLLKVAKDVLGDNVLAVIAASPTYPEAEAHSARKMCEKLQVKSCVITTDEFKDENFVSNPSDRCYHCKKELFSRLRELAQKQAIQHILDGSNHDDLSDIRPGSRAKQEFGIISPLQALGFTKDEIRAYSKELGLATWDKPSMACLASRIPYGTRIEQQLLERINQAEEYLRSLGFTQVRVRHHGTIARIELEQNQLPRIMNNQMMDQINKKLESLGYFYVTLDLKGYRTGSLNL